MALDRATRRAIARYGRSVNSLARSRYGISGQQLLARLVIGESGGNKNAVSPVGARGRAQFMPGSRKIAIDKYGVDPWASADEAIHAAALHLQGKINGSKGLEGYNPGSSSYTGYILGQKAPKDLARNLGISPSGRNTGGSQNPQNVTDSLDAGTVQSLTGLLQQQLAHPQRPSGSAPPLPAYAAGPTMAAQPIQGGSRASTDTTSKLDTLLSSVASPDGTLPAAATQAQAGPSRKASAKAGKGTLRELFYDPGISIDDGKRTGAIGGHSDHVHVAVDNDADRKLVLRLAKRYGVQVTSTGGGNHTEGSFHYKRTKRGKSRAIDFAGDPAAMLAFDKAVARRFR